MHFVLIARDGTDPDAPRRRKAAREAHLRNIEENRARMLMGAATLDAPLPEGAMNGSVMIVDFPSRAALDAWLAAEPYIVQKVWDEVTILPCAVGPSFLKNS